VELVTEIGTPFRSQRVCHHARTRAPAVHSRACLDGQSASVGEEAWRTAGVEENNVVIRLPPARAHERDQPSEPLAGVNRIEHEGFNGAIQTLCERLRQEGRRPYLVPYGVSNALGAVGYASAIDEIATQSSACGFHPSAIVHCTGSAATQAGLVVGASIALKATRVVGIDIDAEPERV
jgi:hypothetical protein